MLQRLKTHAKTLKIEIRALMIASRDPRTPWVAKVLAVLIVAYALSPIDLIPDFVPVLGYLDDLILLPLGILLAIKLIPPSVMDEARQTAAQADGRSLGRVGAIIISLIWLCGLGILVAIAIHIYHSAIHP